MIFVTCRVQEGTTLDVDQNSGKNSNLLFLIDNLYQ